MSEKYRVHEFVKFCYSDIGEYIDEYHTDRPLRNDILVNLLNEQDKMIEELWRENKSYMSDAIKFEKECKRLYNNLRLTNSDLCSEKIMHNHCKKENEQLKKSFDKSLLSHTKICDEYRLLSKKNKRLSEENEQLKREKEFWKGDACKCSNYLSILSMDCQIVQEAICDLKNVIDVDTEAFKLLDKLDDKFDELNQHRIKMYSRYSE